MAPDDTTATLDETAEAPSFDIAAASEQIGADLFPDMGAEPKETPQESVAKALTDSGAAQDQAKQVAEPAVRKVPDSWKKEYHDYWPKLDPKVQDYWEAREREHAEGFTKIKPELQYAKTIRDVLTPYQPLLQSKGLDAPRAIDDMLGTYSRLTQGTMEQRQSALQQVAKNLGIALPGPVNATDPPLPVDPRIQTMEQQMQEMRDIQARREWADEEARRKQIDSEIQAFVSEVDKDGKLTHEFFDDCHQAILTILRGAPGTSLQEAYDQALWATPVTREKSKLAYFQTESEKAKERARLDALPKQKARAVNVKSQDTQRPLTDALGSMDDTLRSTYQKIKERTTH